MRSAMRTVEKRCEMSTDILSFGQFGKAEKDFVFRARIERGSGFVEDEQLGVAHIGAGQSDLLPFAAREVDTAVKTASDHLIEP